ncbi:hypothetical protein BH20ACI2_BH20ACI2_16480 [soil metagenome]
MKAERGHSCPQSRFLRRGQALPYFKSALTSCGLLYPHIWQTISDLTAMSEPGAIATGSNLGEEKKPFTTIPGSDPIPDLGFSPCG